MCCEPRHINLSLDDIIRVLRIGSKSMGDETAISLTNVSKSYKRYARPIDRLKEILLPSKSHAQEFWALQDINLEIPKGQTLGIIGQNGSGKSTLLQIIADTLSPTTGKVKVNGRVSALLELGSGFNPEFTGRQNVFFNGQLLGLSKKEIESKFDIIAGFADIGDFIDEPVKTYSSGMFVRLAFAVAINVEPEILIVDEALSVGDGVFVHRCMAKIKEFQDLGGTILFVSHDTGSVSRLCSKVVWLNQSQLVEIGEPIEVCKHYQAWVYGEINQYQKSQKKEIKYSKNATDEKILPDAFNSENLMKKQTNPYTEKAYCKFENIERFGTGRAEIINIEVLDFVEQPVNFIYPTEEIKLKITILAHDDIEKPIIGCTLYDRLRTPITAWNTYQIGIKLRKLNAGEILTTTFVFKWPEINGGSYTIEPAIGDGTQDSHEMLDWLQCAALIQASVTEITFGIFKIPDINTLIDYHHMTKSEIFSPDSN
jgi:lipopolysaccharide transport system ATP-binding protein